MALVADSTSKNSAFQELEWGDPKTSSHMDALLDNQVRCFPLVGYRPWLQQSWHDSGIFWEIVENVWPRQAQNNHPYSTSVYYELQLIGKGKANDKLVTNSVGGPGRLRCLSQRKHRCA